MQVNFNEKTPVKARSKKARKYNRGVLLPDEVKKFRQMVNDENYINNAIENIAEQLSGEIRI